MEIPPVSRPEQQKEPVGLADITSLDLRHLVLHQAAGMVSVQLGVDVGEALCRLREYAANADCELVGLAQDVVDRSIRLDSPVRH